MKWMFSAESVRYWSRMRNRVPYGVTIGDVSGIGPGDPAESFCCR